MRLDHSLLILAVVLLIGCDDASQRSQPENAGASKDATDNLPEWLQKRPSDIKEEKSLKCRAELIELRTPLLRSDGYTAAELKVVTAKIEHYPGEFEDKIKLEWDKKWKSQLKSYKRTGGCGCCNEVYTITGPKAAAEEFPMSRIRRKHYPIYIYPEYYRNRDEG